MDKRKKIIGLIVTGILGIGIVFGAVKTTSVYAQTPTPAAPASPAAPNAQGQQPGFGKGMHEGARDGARGGYTEADFAAALGITTEQLQAAEKTATSDALKEAVSKGLITQAQADEYAANGFMPRFFGERGQNAQNGIDYNALLAKALNITTDQLQAARLKALSTSVDAAVKAGTLTQAQADLIKGRAALEGSSKFQSAMQSAYEAAVKQAVTDGVITQAQADAILAQQPKWGGGMGPGFGGRHGGHGHGFGGPGFDGAPGTQNNTTPSTPSGSGV